MSNDRILIELSEYKTISSSTESNESERNKLAELSITAEDIALKDYLKEKGILTILELKKGLQITASSHIGIAQFSNFSTIVLPKFLMNYPSLPKLIEYSYDLEDLIIPESEIKFKDTKNILIEIIISSFLKQCQKLLNQGLVKSYVTHEENIPYLKGKLLLQQQFMNSAHKRLQFACEYDELEYDILENKILLTTLETCYNVTKNESLKKNTRRLIHQISGFVNKSIISIEDFDKINYTRMNQHYQKPHQLCKLILSSTGIGDFYKEKIPYLNSFFIDMNVIFEAFVAKLFQQFYPFPSKAQNKKKVWKTDEGSTANIRTDILICDDHGNIQNIIDTKYKKELHSGDRFQIGFYIHEYEKKEGYAILPEQAESKDHKIISEQQGITINVKHINIDQILEMVFSDTDKSAEIQKELVRLVPSG